MRKRARRNGTSGVGTGGRCAAAPPPPNFECVCGGGGGRPGIVREDVYRYSHTGIFENSGADPGLENESWPRARSFFFWGGGSETADPVRDRRQRSWKVFGNGGAGPGLGDGGADSGPGGSIPKYCTVQRRPEWVTSSPGGCVSYYSGCQMLPTGAADQGRSRGLAVWFSFHTWRCGVRIPGESDTFLNAIGELFSIAVGFRSGKVRVG